MPKKGGEKGKDASNEARSPSPRESLLLFLRDIALAFLVVAVVMGLIFAYTQVWPPMVVVESQSMQHCDRVNPEAECMSYIGVIDAGDLVLVQNSPNRGDVITWVEGKVASYWTYNNYGDVIVFHKPNNPSATPIIHRAILWLRWNDTARGYDAPSLEALSRSEWGGMYANGAPVERPYGLNGEIWLARSGYKGDLNISFQLGVLAQSFRYSGYITMGDNNAYSVCQGSAAACKLRPYDGWVVPQNLVIGRARGELPWFGLLKLTLFPSDACCSRGWGDPSAPRNSWDALLISLVVIISAPIAVDFGLSYLMKWRKTRKETETISDNPHEEPEEKKNSH